MPGTARLAVALVQPFAALKAHRKPPSRYLPPAPTATAHPLASGRAEGPALPGCCASCRRCCRQREMLKGGRWERGSEQERGKKRRRNRRMAEEQAVVLEGEAYAS